LHWKRDMSNCFLAYFKSGETVYECVKSVFEANSLGVYYCEILFRYAQDSECCCLIVHRKGPAARCAIWDRLLAAVKFSDVRQVGGLSVMQGLRYIRLLSKLWKDSVLSVSHEEEEVSRELNSIKSSDETNERALVFRCVDLIGALHSSFDEGVFERHIDVSVTEDSCWQTKLGAFETLQKPCMKGENVTGLQRDAIEKLRTIGRSMRRGSLPEAYIASFMSRNLAW
jgi:hypothetical protein